MPFAPVPSADPPWPDLPRGVRLQVVKLAPDGSEAARYPAEVIDAGAPPSWVAVRATWVSRNHNLDGLLFIAGDTLHEFFSPAHPFNVFSVWSPAGMLRGWYANVTHPTRLETASEPFVLTWHDLYLDIVALPDGTTVVRDQDELDEAGLAESDPELHAMIRAACDELVARAHDRAFPFHEADPNGSVPRAPTPSTGG